MSYTKHNYKKGDTLLASQLNEMDDQIALNETVADNLKTALTDVSENVDRLNRHLSDVVDNAFAKRAIKDLQFIHVKDAANVPLQDVIIDASATKITQAGKNLFYPAGERVPDRYYKANGDLGNSNSWYISEFIEVFPETEYTITGVTVSSTAASMKFFDADKVALGTKKYNGTDKNTFTTPQNCYYISVSVQRSVDHPQLEVGSMATEYEAAHFTMHSVTSGILDSSITMLEGINNLWSDYGNVSVVYSISTSAKASANLNQSGKYCLVYRFGGSGNDWCFVRTPEHYDPERSKPYPFVICNHGNAWVMDGTERFANWTKRTMYVPFTDSDYIANPTQYNGTDDESLWYSNPTIEALLAAGYVVCGCENYGDNLFGNDNCRNACVDFFHHMVNTYNVEDRCYMIGASNGAMTSLNAAYLLQGAVKAMVLQYPLTCLLNQYNSNTSQQANIRAAYGISTSTPTQEELATAFRTHDPLTTDVVSNIKVGVIPPIKFWYSPDDTAVNYQQNTIALYDLLTASGKVCETVQASGAHGDYTHFDPAATVAWFESH